MYFCFMKELNKELMAGSLAPMILLILNRQESYGYEIIQQITNKSGGKLNIAEGTLYPVLKKMEEKEWLKSHWKRIDGGRARKYYVLTDKGQNELDQQMSQWNFINNIIDKLCSPQNATLMKQSVITLI